ncbi:hypothetical protein GCM10009785_02200 [Brooklawnia cerclae]|uniref:Transcriptional regulator with XRE-family HTH domain n=1 Tax=Brooklawnia cerclae TaxID=349934 RepID=A0ABX0SHT9_9ACTN|nr:hypothetical protein [Brooklawnia cerclae]NIH56186.1 transcriptional regulator with XRE-family HTH domain [Brooklawnia cerclae]
MARVMVRSGVLQDAQETSGIDTDDAMARAIGVSKSTYQRVRDRRQSPTSNFIAGACIAFSLSIDQLVELIVDETETNLDPAA